jgi:hypothetical protein
MLKVKNVGFQHANAELWNARGRKISRARRGVGEVLPKLQQLHEDTAGGHQRGWLSRWCFQGDSAKKLTQEVVSAMADSPGNGDRVAR